MAVSLLVLTRGGVFTIIHSPLPSSGTSHRAAWLMSWLGDLQGHPSELRMGHATGCGQKKCGWKWGCKRLKSQPAATKPVLAPLRQSATAQEGPYQPVLTVRGTAGSARYACAEQTVQTWGLFPPHGTAHLYSCCLVTQ